MVLALQLTEQQRQAIEAQRGRPVEVVDPVTSRVYVLVAAEMYERVRDVMEEAAPLSAAEPSPLIAPQMLRSQQAFWRDLPGLHKLKSRKRQWVGYHGDERVGFGKTQTEVYQQCFRRGLQRGEFYVGKLEADPEGLPPWGTLQSDWSLYEATEEEEGETPPGTV